LNGRHAHFLFVVDDKRIAAILKNTLDGLGYEMIDLELSRTGALVRVFIDRPGGVDVGDCAIVSNHLTRLLAVEGVEYERLEVSSPGLDRPLKTVEDFRRFAGERAQVKMRLPLQGRKNFVGVLRGADAAGIQLEVDGALLSLDLSLIDKARLVPNI
jgi:ribosome maturation factor RimP